MVVIGGCGGRVAGPVTAGGVDPVDSCSDGDAEHLGEDDSGDFGGEVLLGGSSSGPGVDAMGSESLTELAGGDGPSG